MKRIFLLCLVIASPFAEAFACITCDKRIQQGIYNSQFYPNLLTMLSAFIVLTLIVGIFSSFSTRRYKQRRKGAANVTQPSPVPMTTAAMVLGIGLGGFADGIVLHQILQWHEMLSNKIPATSYIGKSVNMFWDGIFHAFCLIVTLVGVVLLWQTAKRREVSKSGWLLAGGLLAGWGVFNIVEGIIDHQVLELHYVMQYSADPDIANYTFLASSVLMLAVGLLLLRRGGKETSVT